MLGEEKTEKCGWGSGLGHRCLTMKKAEEQKEENEFPQNQVATGET